MKINTFIGQKSNSYGAPEHYKIIHYLNPGSDPIFLIENIDYEVTEINHIKINMLNARSIKFNGLLREGNIICIEDSVSIFNITVDAQMALSQEIFI